MAGEQVTGGHSRELPARPALLTGEAEQDLERWHFRSKVVDCLHFDRPFLALSPTFSSLTA